jgi:AbrB family transcriptional regulator, transcriptional pleiotropic regulator of transition state genes
VSASGIRRKVDDLGRVVIPAGVRRALNIREGDPVEVTVEGERVVLAKPRDACVFCGREDPELPTFRSRRVCRQCLASLAVVDEREQTVEAANTSREPTATQPVQSIRPVPADAEEAAPPPPPPPTPLHHRPAATARPAEPLPTGPIDGDAMARRAAARERDALADEERRPTRRRPPHDPASTTAW